jgi:hypothetical protein
MTETPESEKRSKEKQLQIITIGIWFGMVVVLLIGFVLFPFLKILPSEELQLVQIVIVFVVIAELCLLGFLRKKLREK